MTATGIDSAEGKNADSSARAQSANRSSALTPEDAFETLKTYFETSTASRKALGSLREGVEIAVSIGGAVDCAVLQRGGAPIVEKRAAKNPDFTFTIRPETVYVLAKQPSEDVGDVGISILKEMIAGNVSARMTGNVFSVLSSGYLDIVKKGGSKFAAKLAEHGLSSATKIMAAVKKMRG